MRADYDKAKGPTAKGIPTCGLSMSTMGSNDLNFTKIMDHGRHKLILYIRTNVAKMGIAMKRGLLVELTGGKRNRIYYAEAIFDAIYSD